MKVKISIIRYILGAVAISSQLGSAYAQSNTVSQYNYGSGTTTLEDDIDNYYDASIPDEVIIQGTAGGGTIIDGDGHHGYQFISPYKPITVRVRDIDAFINFEDTIDNDSATPEGGAAFYISGDTHLEFEGYDRDNRLHFQGDNSNSDGNDNDGGALSVQYGGTVGDIYADFRDNHARYPDGLPSVPLHNYYARGGAINVAGTTGSGTVGNIYGTFTINTAEYGGAIYVGRGGVTGDIEGTFFANYASAGHKAGGTTGGSAGGAIRVYYGTVGNITGVFDSNATYADDTETTGTYSTSQGGAIALDGTTFTEGATITAEIKNNISYSESSHAYGGGVYLYDQSSTRSVYITDSNIIGNSVATQLETANAYGGGYYIDLSDAVYIDAINQDVIMRDNREIVGGTFDEDGNLTGGTRDYNAIYSKESTIHLRAFNDKQMIIDDSIESEEKTNLVLDSTSTEKYDISVNAELRNMDVIVKNGGLILGSYTHDPDGDNVTTTADFVGGTLTVEAGSSAADTGVVNTSADNLNGATAISNRGIIEFTGGTLTKGINDVAMISSKVSPGATAGAKTGSLHILGETSVASDVIIFSDTILMDDKLKVAAAASIDVNTLLYQGVNKNEINSQEHIVLTPDATLAFDSVKLDINYAVFDDYFDLVISDGTGNIADLYSSEFNVEFTLGGQLLTQDVDYIVEERAEDGGLRVRFIGEDVVPEPSTATLSLLALTALMARRRRKI